METWRVSTLFWLVLAVICSRCEADNSATDERLDSILNQLQQHSQQNSQIIRHLADLAEELQVGLVNT